MILTGITVSAYYLWQQKTHRASENVLCISHYLDWETKGSTFKRFI